MLPPPARAQTSYQQHGEDLHLPEAGLAHLHDHHEEREEVTPSTPAPHTAHARTRSPSRTRLTAAEPSPPPVALLPRSYKKFVKYLSKELKANGKAFDFTIAGAKWASQEEGHEFKFEFGEA